MNDREPRATALPRAPELAVPPRQRRVNALYQAILALALVGSTVTVSILGNRTRQMQKELADLNQRVNAARNVAVTLRRNTQLTGLNGSAAPSFLLDAQRTARRGAALHNDRGFVVMVYTAGACERSINDGLRSLNRATASLAAHGLATVALKGVASAFDREQGLLLMGEGQYEFRMVFTDALKIVAALFPPSDSAFAEEPIYLRVDERSKIISAFHADQRRPELLDAWLEVAK